MSRAGLTALSLASLLLAVRPAVAQPEPEEPYEEINPEPTPPPPPPSPEATPPPPPPTLPPSYDARTEKQRRRDLDRWLKDNDPEYRGAISRRNAGIVVTSVVTPVGLVVALVGGLVWAVCDSVDGSCDDAAGWTIGGLVTMGVGLGVGIPLIVSGQSRVNEIRERASRGSALLPRVRLSFRQRGGQLGLSWEF